MEEVDAALLNPSVDICEQLMQRYSSSAASQHRHLIATAAALKSLIQQQHEQLIPLSYFGAAMSALSNTSFQNDAASSSALATLLSIALPLVPQGSISPHNAADAANLLVRVLGDAAAVASTSTSAAKCVVKCLGVLLGFCDFSTWNSLQLPFETLLIWSIHKPPKVRKCALVYLENAFKSFQSESVTEKASELIQSSLENCISSADKLGILKKLHGPGSDTHHEPECSDIVHVLAVVRVSLPYLSNQVSVNIINKLLELLDARFSAFTRLILSAVEVFLDKADFEVITLVDEAIIDALALYLSIKTNSTDSLVLAAKLVKVALDKMHSGDTSKWQKCFSPGIKAIAGLLICEDDIASESSNILKKLIDHLLVDFESHQAIEAVKDPESNTIASICSVFMSLLESFPDIPNEHTLSVISVLFLKLGRNASLYMRNIVLKMAEILIAADVNECDTSHLQKCFGCAVVALGAEDILNLVPFSFNAEKLTCSNMWLLPILKKYTFGASLRYFMDHIVPVAKSLQRAARKVKKSVTGQDLQAHAQVLWGLLPAFCRHPTDISESFQSLSKLMLVQLKKDTSRHEDIAEALQELVRRSECRSKSDVSIAESPECSSDALLEDDILEKRALIPFSKKDAKRDIKALSSQSNELLQALTTIFLDSPPENCSSLKKAIGCLASITKCSSAKKIFILSLERFPLVKAVIESGDLSDGSQIEMPCSVGAESQWPLSLDLASSFVKGADEDFLGYLAVGEDILHSDTNHKEEERGRSNLGTRGGEGEWGLYITPNIFSCLKVVTKGKGMSSSDVENTKPFLILNCIILALKDILGYLSGPSPHITSAAVSALSVLVFKEPELCVKVPDLVPSVTSLLQAKAVEVTKVTVIIEIMIRKCGFPAVKLVTPERYQPFIRKVSLNRQGKTTTKEADSVDMNQQSSDISTFRPKKRIRDETQNDEGGSRFNREKRQMQTQGSHPRGRVERSDFRSSRKPNIHFNKKNAGIGRKSEKPNTHRDKTFARPRQNGPRSKQTRNQ
ncbi:hypothetical protein KSS87_015671 [Heliosperma pusillum]|nr:hypothetical protein KSS87_015671 [Heliosperma pusillum]